ncbi:uncharacterized protein LOC121846489 isoform X16 [Oncorhynchus tshawytscha]|uniref:uncharacterized protein LOC121846489 isoform X16 n=1 Tax=Oncorhynchus tshawytscha TaxID=74940 RepID=UPI001C3E26EC|nr:uncharacterized protein LOC121846489 isoform X16 [Oncorhynchus tshawytscha]
MNLNISTSRNAYGISFICNFQLVDSVSLLAKCTGRDCRNGKKNATPVTADQTWMRKIQSVANNWNCRPEWMEKVHLVASWNCRPEWMEKVHLVASWNCRPEWMGKVHLVASWMQTRNGILYTRTWLPVTPVTADQTWMRKIQSVANNWNCRPEWMEKVHLVASWNCRPEWMGKVHLVASWMQTRNGILYTRTWLPVTPVTADQTWMRKIQSVANNWNCRPEWMEKVHLVASWKCRPEWMEKVHLVASWNCRPEWMEKVHLVASWKCRPEWMEKVHLVASWHC